MKQNNKFNLDKYLLLAGILTLPLILILFFLIFPLMYSGHSSLTKGISYLGAIESPIRIMVNVLGFSLWGVLTMIFGYGVFRSKLLGITGKIAGIFLIIGGFMIYLIGVFPESGMDGIFTLGGELHNIFTDYSFNSISIAFFLFIFEFVINKRFRWLILPIIILGSISLFFYFMVSYQTELLYFGIVQRAVIVPPFLIIMLIGISLYSQ